MHYHCEVWIPEFGNGDAKIKAMLRKLEGQDVVEKLVSKAMAPYREQNYPKKGFWDWYQIGGRWKGAHVKGYDPEKDPENSKAGTSEVDWPTNWKRHKYDIMAITEIPDSMTCFTLVLPKKVIKSEFYHPEKEKLEDKFEQTPFKIKEELSKAGIKNGYLVTVDYHC